MSFNTAKRRGGPRTFGEFRANHMPERLISTLIVSGMLGLLVAAFALTIFGEQPALQAGEIISVSVMWAIATPLYLSYLLECFRRAISTVWLPWRQVWPLLFVLITWPFLLLWVVAFIRLAINWKRLAPSPYRKDV
jgi:hypothetical protein